MWPPPHNLDIKNQSQLDIWIAWNFIIQKKSGKSLAQLFLELIKEIPDFTWDSEEKTNVEALINFAYLNESDELFIVPGFGSTDPFSVKQRFKLI